MDGERLYGSVSAVEIADALKGQGVTLDRSQIALPEHLKQTGAFGVPVKLHADVTVTIKVWIVKE